MNMRPRRPASGFTVIELLVVIILIIILVALIVLTFSGIRTKNRNADRQTDIKVLQAQLESFYAVHTKYPTLTDLNNIGWRKENLKKLPIDGLQDPRWSKSLTACTTNNQAAAAAEPTANCYSYQVTASDGSACDNVKADCGHYTLTANLEGGDKYVKSSLN